MQDRKIKAMYNNVLKTYESLMVIERDREDATIKADQQWINIMHSMLSLMLATDADDVFLENDEKMAEYDAMVKKYGSIFGNETPTHK